MIVNSWLKYGFIISFKLETDESILESRKPHRYVANAYADVDEEDEEYGSKTDYR